MRLELSGYSCLPGILCNVLLHCAISILVHGSTSQVTLIFAVIATGAEPSPEACNVHQDLWTVDVVVPSYGCHVHSLPAVADSHPNMA